MNTSSTSGGRRHAKRLRITSALPPFWELVASERVWRVIEHVEAAVPTLGRRCGYTLMDIVVMDVAAQLFGSNRAAERYLGDPNVWERLRRHAVTAFPKDPARRLSQRAPSRQAHYRARKAINSSAAVAEFKRALRTEAVAAATHMDMFVPAAGTWAAPDVSQCIVGDSVWLSTATKHRAPSGTPPGVQQGRELVVLACSRPDANERVVLDAEFVPSRRGPTRDGRNGADHAVEMLSRLLTETASLLRPGLRGFVHDMALTSEAADKTLELGVLPITKVPRAAGGTCRRVNLGTHTFTAPDGTQHAHEVAAIGGSPTVALTDSRGAVLAVPLDRQHIRWGRNGQQRHVAYGRYAMPHAPPVPAHLRGASAVIRFNSTNQEVIAGRRRTQALRAIPETDADFAELFGRREDMEAMFADLKHPARHAVRDDFGIVIYQIRRLVDGS